MTSEDGSEGVGTGDEALLGDNALNPNALNPNALNPNALNPNALNPNALNPITDSASAGPPSRLLLRYIVGCALDATQTFFYSWTDAAGLTHDETFFGGLGLAPSWYTTPLDVATRKLVSACVAARTNYYGTPVEISIRGPQAVLNHPTSAELADFPAIEGAFWGDLFAPVPYLRACYNSTNAANSRAWQRDCASGHLDGSGGTVPCGLLTIAGSCSSLCGALDPTGQFYPTCNDPLYGATTGLVTTALPNAPAAGSTSNLSVTTSGPATVTTSACGSATYTLTVQNLGTVTAPTPTVVDTLPDGLTFAAATTTSGSCSSGGKTIVCTLANLAPAGTATVTIKAIPNVTAGTVTNSAFVISSLAESSTATNTSTFTTQLVAPAFAAWESSTNHFNGTPIAKGNTVWFTLVAKMPKVAPPVTTVLSATGSTIALTANGKNYSVSVPSMRIKYSSAVTTARVTFDPFSRAWTNTLPQGTIGIVFAGAFSFVVPEDFPGATDVTWSVHFESNLASFDAAWQWAAAVYTPFNRDYNLLDISPADDTSVNPFNNKDKAGTPEAYRDLVIGGARGGGGSNYTGSRVGAVTGTPAVVSCL